MNKLIRRNNREEAKAKAELKATILMAKKARRKAIKAEAEAQKEAIKAVGKAQDKAAEAAEAATAAAKAAGDAAREAQTAAGAADPPRQDSKLTEKKGNANSKTGAKQAAAAAATAATDAAREAQRAADAAAASAAAAKAAAASAAVASKAVKPAADAERSAAEAAKSADAAKASSDEAAESAARARSAVSAQMATEIKGYNPGKDFEAWLLHNWEYIATAIDNLVPSPVPKLKPIFPCGKSDHWIDLDPTASPAFTLKQGAHPTSGNFGTCDLTDATKDEEGHIFIEAKVTGNNSVDIAEANHRLFNKALSAEKSCWLFIATEWSFIGGTAPKIAVTKIVVVGPTTLSALTERPPGEVSSTPQRTTSVAGADLHIYL